MARFVKGQSGNPGGKRKNGPVPPDIKALAQAHTPEVIERLAFWMRSKHPHASVTSCGMLLDRAFGRPPQAHTGPDGEALTLRMVITGILREVDDGGSGEGRAHLPRLQSPTTIQAVPREE